MMKRLLFLILVFASSCSKGQLLPIIAKQAHSYYKNTTISPAAPIVDTNNVYLFFLFGQSNAVGVNNPNDAGASDPDMLDDLPEDWRTAQSNINIWWTGDYTTTVSGHFEAMQPVVNTRNKVHTNPADEAYAVCGWGIEQKLSHLLLANQNKRVYIVKSAISGITLSYWESGGSMRTEMDNFTTGAISALQAAGKTVTILGAIWLEGESDANNGTYSNYATRFEEISSHFRGLDVSLINCPIIHLKLRTDGIIANTTALNSQIDTWLATNANNYSIDPMTLTTPLIDGIHYKNLSKANLGQALYDFLF